MSSDTDNGERGFFARLKAKLNQGKSWIGSNIASALGRNIDDDVLTELEDELLLADVGVETTDVLIEALKNRACGADAGDKTLVTLLTECVTELLEPLEQPLIIRRNGSPKVVLVVGVNGTGKTTTTGKLAQRLREDGLTVLLAAGDTFRAAAVEQLHLWAERSGSIFVSQAEGADPAAVVHDALAAARSRHVDVVIADTAGRLHTASGLMDELEKIRRVVNRFDADAPHEVLLVLDATQGQNALTQAKEFQRRIGVTGLVITKLDGSAKGGIVLAIARELKLPIRFIGVGEQIDDFDVFRASSFAAAMIEGGSG